MTDKELDQMLQQALSSEISDDEIKVSNKMEGKRKMKISKIVKPVVVVAASIAVVVVAGNVKMPTNGTIDKPIKANENTSEKETILKTFNIKLQAAEVKKLKKGKAEVMVSSGKGGGAVWNGNPDNNTVSYCIAAPLICEGDNIKTITYEINKGAFQIYTKKDSNYILQGVECKRKIDGGEVAPSDEDSEKYEQKQYTSYSILPENQTSNDVYVDICNECKVSKKLYKRIWDHRSLEESTKGLNEVFGNLVITCTVTYKDDTSESVDIVVENKIMTYREAGVDKTSIKADMKTDFTTFEMK